MRLLLAGGVLGTAVALLFLRRRGAPAWVNGRISPLRRRDANLQDLTRDELYERAQKADIPGRSEMTKDELIKALRAAG
jgi:DNA end-binding protein Ku